MSQDGSALRLVSPIPPDAEYELVVAQMLLDVARIVATNTENDQPALRLDGLLYLVERIRHHVSLASEAVAPR